MIMDRGRHGRPVNELHRPPPGSRDLAVGLDQATIEGLRAMIRAGGVQQLAVGGLCAGEVAELAWSGNPAHLRSAAAALQRAAQGLEDYLAVRAPGGEPVAKMRIDYTSEAGAGVFSQLATMARCRAWASPPCSSARASSASMPATWRSQRSAPRQQPRGTSPLRAARIPGGRPPARIMGD